MLPVARLRTDDTVQPRLGLDTPTVHEYREAMEEGAAFPAILVFDDGEVYWVADGFHRVEAARRAGHDTIEAIVRQGTRRDAALAAVGANAMHGLRRSNDDKSRAVRRLLADPEWMEWSNREIARRCRVSEGMVRSLRTVRSDTSRCRTKHGGETTMNTAQIKGAPNARTSCASLEWWTPPEIVDPGREMFGGFSLDVASCEGANKIVKATEFYTEREDGLTRPWFGSVWMNAPYGIDHSAVETNGSRVGMWLDRLGADYDDGLVVRALALVYVESGRGWFKPLWQRDLCFLDKQVRHISPDGRGSSPTKHSVIVHFGDDLDAFRKHYGQLGHIVPAEWRGVR